MIDFEYKKFGTDRYTVRILKSNKLKFIIRGKTVATGDSVGDLRQFS